MSCTKLLKVAIIAAIVILFITANCGYSICSKFNSSIVHLFEIALPVLAIGALIKYIFFKEEI